LPAGARLLSTIRGFVTASTAAAAAWRHASGESAGTSGQPMEKAMSQRSKFKKCAWCGNPFPVVDGQVLQWRVDGERFACNEFCAEGIAEQSAKPATS
jgi:hypothetical protein